MQVSPTQQAWTPSPHGPPTPLQAGCPPTHWPGVVDPAHSQLSVMTLGMHADVE
jgi:hypothetical protein